MLEPKVSEADLLGISEVVEELSKYLRGERKPESRCYGGWIFLRTLPVEVAFRLVQTENCHTTRESIWKLSQSNNVS
jgi:hypothetical protein